MASKSKKRRRVLGASCILAALIIAGSSFAWFTSSDEVTNRLAANADYGVRIVESFAPPANWLPGQEVDKDVYATNTGTVAAYVKESVSSVLTITEEKDVTGTWGTGDGAGTISTLKIGTADVALDDCVELNETQRYVMEAGSYLAYKPAGDTANALGRQIVAFDPNAAEAVPTYVYRKTTSPYDEITEDAYTQLTTEEKKNYTKLEITAAKTDFTPAANGLYVFRRSIDVSQNDRNETFTYDGYYFNNGKFYKITDLKVTPDENSAPYNAKERDKANDGSDWDGRLDAAECKLLKDVQTVVKNLPLTYDAQYNRLVANYGETKDKSALLSTVGEKATALEHAEHNLAKARTALDSALREAGESDAAVKYWSDIVAQLEAELAAVQARINELGRNNTTNDTIRDTLQDQADALQTAMGASASADGAWKNAETQLAVLYGTSNKAVTFTNTLNADGTGDVTYSIYDETGKTVDNSDGYFKQLLQAQKDVDDKKAVDGEDIFKTYVRELATIASVTAEYQTNTGTALTATTPYDDVVANVGFETLNAVTADSLATGELHTIHTLTKNLAEKQKQYDETKALALGYINEYITDAIRLGIRGTEVTDATTTVSATDGTTTIEETYTTTTINPAAPGSGVLGELSASEAEAKTLIAKETALQTLINKAEQEAIKALTTSGSSNTASSNLETAKANYIAALGAYKSAYDAYVDAQEAYDKADTLKIYINLSDDVVETGGVANQWQIVTTAGRDSDDADGVVDTFDFYYTSILEGGETSTKLIDSVELDKGATQNMYKSFDFDVNVALDSVQITYKNNDKEIDTASASELGKSAALSNNKDINTAITWS